MAGRAHARAMSRPDAIAHARSEINDVIYLGLATEGANTVLGQSPLFDESYLAAWAEFDIDKANELLDEIGLTNRNDDGLRLLPDGRPLAIVVETTGQSPEEVADGQIGKGHGGSGLGNGFGVLGSGFGFGFWLGILVRLRLPVPEIPI